MYHQATAIRPGRSGGHRVYRRAVKRAVNCHKSAGWVLVWAGSVAAIAACDRNDPPPPKIERQPRVINSPPQGVQALPPHAIRADGVGPYRLGVPLEQLGNQVPSGAQNAQVDIPRVVHLNVLHAEDDAILVGAADSVGRASFVAVVRGDIARTASGIHVGSTRDDLVGALGPPTTELERARDPRILVPKNMRELRALIGESDQVAGIVVSPAEPVAKTGGGCTRPNPDATPAPMPRATAPVGKMGSGGRSAKAIDPEDARSETRAETRGETRTQFGACISGSPDILAVDDGDLSLRVLDSERTIALPKVPNLVWAGPARNPEGRDEVVAIARADDAQSRTWFLYVYRVDPGLRIVKVVDAAPVYQLTAANARWLGCELVDLDLAIEVTSHGEAFEMGGLLFARRGDLMRDLFVLSPVQVPVRTGISSGRTTGVDSHPKVIGR